MAKKNPKRPINEQDKINFSKGKKFTSEYQPAPKKKSKGKLKANAEKREVEKTVDILTRVLQKVIKDGKGNELTAKEAMLVSLLNKSLKGDIRAIELIIKIIGEMPSEKLDVHSLGFNVLVEDAKHKQMLEEL